jgi:hypothetical protein
VGHNVGYKGDVGYNGGHPHNIATNLNPNPQPPTPKPDRPRAPDSPSCTRGVAWRPTLDTVPPSATLETVPPPATSPSDSPLFVQECGAHPIPVVSVGLVGVTRGGVLPPAEDNFPPNSTPHFLSPSALVCPRVGVAGVPSESSDGFSLAVHLIRPRVVSFITGCITRLVLPVASATAIPSGCITRLVLPGAAGSGVTCTSPMRRRHSLNTRTTLTCSSCVFVCVYV